MEIRRWFFFRTLRLPVATALVLTYIIHICLSFVPFSSTQVDQPGFQVLAIAETGGHHVEYTRIAKQWLNKLASDSNFSIEFISNTDKLDENYLNQFRLIIQLDYPPYGWKGKAVKAFEKYIEEGRGGWIGFHHATLLGEFDGFPMWKWFHEFMGTIRFRDYIANFASGDVNVEDRYHPVMRQLPPVFTIKKEEWYTYDKSPRLDSAIQVIASVNEESYSPSSEKKMGDHPVIWTNKNMKARNIYIFMGHSPVLFEDKNYTTLFRNAIFWAAGK